MPQLTWLITGASSGGFGEEFVKQILDRGDRVIATARTLSKITQYEELGAKTLQLDVTASQSDLDKKAQEALAFYGGIDVLVSNAGYAVMGTVEETSHETLVNQYNTNVFGLVNVIRSFLPHFRQKRSGTIILMSSIGGYEGGPLYGPYCSSKFAVECIGESLWHELSPIGVKALTVVPGYFRTSFLKDGNVNMIESKIPEYKELNDKALGALNAYNGHQPGDPQKGVARIIDVVRQEGAAEGRGIPQRLFLGSDSVRDIGRQLKNVLQLLEEWKDFAESTDLPKGT